MKRVFLLGLILPVLAACGADGEPEQPASDDGREDVRVTGDATVGISVGSSGTQAYGGVGLGTGPVSIWLGF